MAALPTTLHYPASFNDLNSNSSLLIKSKAKLKFPNSPSNKTLAHTFHCIRGSNSVYSRRNVYVSNVLHRNQEAICDQMNGTLHNLKRWFEFIRSIFPGGSWWNLSDSEQKIDGSTMAAKPLTVLKALRQMWALVADEKWILCAAFVALTVVAVSEISMPGICSGLRSGCFAIANTILVKRLRETLYSSLLLQDISFFDKEAVGNLTSRISTDCLRLSHTIGNDIHLILRNIVQGIGAFITLMTLSWPLAMSSLAVCVVLSAIFLIYGQYQKKTALLAQDFTASANEVAQETLSLMRTVRAYGTEREEYQSSRTG